MNPPVLKPCPFCGSPAVLGRDPGSYGYMPETVWVECSLKQCFAKTNREQTEEWAPGLGHYTVEAQAVGMVAEKWNTRARGVE